MSYDDYGNSCPLADARGNTTTTDYERGYHASGNRHEFLSFELRRTTTYDAKTRPILTATDINGQAGAMNTIYAAA